MTVLMTATGLSDAAYTVGQVLGMDLPEPDEPEYDD